MLFHQFAGIDAWPLCLSTQDPDEIVRTVKAIAPSFGGINLEDISAPRCFEIERRLQAELDIPVMHDDQHGTAVVVLAALLNALKVTKQRLADVGGGLGALAGKVWRIGLMGESSQKEHVLTLLQAIETICIREHGRLPKGQAQMAAISVYDSPPSS